MATTQVKEHTAAQPILRHPEIIFTHRAVESSEIIKQVPPGYRIASPNEIALLWNASSEFRERLCSLPGGAWTNQKGLHSSGRHKITTATKKGITNAAFKSITEKQFAKLDDKDRSWHSPGKSLVAVYGVPEDKYTYEDRFGLGVHADFGPNQDTRVALVKLSPEELVEQAFNQQTASQKSVPVELVSQFRGLVAKLEPVMNRNTGKILKEVLRSIE